MKSIGIIAEFNPFHQGHQYLIEKVKKETGAEVCVSVMTGNFTQRGTPAIFDKWTRAQSAIEKGVNLVVELPAIYSCNSSDFFAKGGVEILEALGCDYIAFGSECGDIDTLLEAAHFISNNYDLLQEDIRKLTNSGISYPRARQQVINNMDVNFDVSLISEPNNILALEYIRHATKIKPYTIKRRGYGYHQSATLIRDEMLNENPEKFRQLKDNYWKMVCARIMQMTPFQLEEIYSAGSGLGNKLKKEIRYASSREKLIEGVKSKAYTYSRISRYLTQILLNIDKNAVYHGGNYIRILATDEIGRKFLKEAKKSDNITLPVITNVNKDMPSDEDIKGTFEIDILATDMYNMITERDLYDFSDYVKKPYVK